MTPTVWFLVTLFAVGDHWAMRPNAMPEEYVTQQECMDAGVSKMIDRRLKSIKLVCVEADDAQDLHKILNEAFRFPGQDS